MEARLAKSRDQKSEHSRKRATGVKVPPMENSTGNAVQLVDEADAIRRAMAEFDKHTTFPDKPEYKELQRAQKMSWARTLTLEAQRLTREAEEQA